MLETLEYLWEAGRGLHGPAGATVRITGILIVAWFVLRVVGRALNAMKERMIARIDDAEAAKRALTLARVFRYAATVVISLITVVLVLSEVGISIAPILGAAGVVGLAVGFGAQSLVKDFFTGFVMLVENQIRQGDIVRLGEHAGVVENITLRYVQLRDYAGMVYFIPNGQINSVINMSRGFAHAVIDAGVGYSADIDQVIAVMREVGNAMREDAEWSDKLIGEFEIAGVDSWGDSAVTVRGRIRTQPGQQWAVRRELLRRLKYAFDKAGIEIPFPQRTVHMAPPREKAAPAAPTAPVAPAAPPAEA